jgi:hypothetical protein
MAPHENSNHYYLEAKEPLALRCYAILPLEKMAKIL